MNDNNLDIKQLADKDIRLLAFDADDTLWDCQGHFDNVEKAYAQLLAPYADEPTVAEMLFQTETANMPLLGYGSKAFTLSLVENAVKVSRGQIAAADVLHALSASWNWENHCSHCPPHPYPRCAPRWRRCGSRGAMPWWCLRRATCSTNRTR